jgi:hypothetical protein
MISPPQLGFTEHQHFVAALPVGQIGGHNQWNWYP